MALTIILVIVLVILGVVGLARGVRRGVVTLAGTLLGAVLVDLWQEPWAAWLADQFSPEQLNLWTFVLTATLFVLVTLVVGYGGGILLRDDPKAKPPGLLDRLLGGLVGVLNGALIISYLLRYAAQIWPSGVIDELVAASLPAAILLAWLPWFILALVITTSAFVLLRGTWRVGQALSTRPAAKPQTTPAAAPKSTGTPPPPANPPAAPNGDKRILDKINQRIGEP